VLEEAASGGYFMGARWVIAGADDDENGFWVYCCCREA
jgi:hypothetical protein